MWSMSWLPQEIRSAGDDRPVKDPTFTIRISGDLGWLSRDDGETWCLGDHSVRQVREVVDEAQGEAAMSAEIGQLTAATRAVIGEAMKNQPRADVDPSDHEGIVEASDGKAVGGAVLSESRPLRNVLENRASERRLRPPTFQQLATVLIRAGRVRSWQETEHGGQKATRALPSAGGCNPIELHVVTTDILGLGSGWWTFEPLSCRLLRVDSVDDPMEKVRKSVAERGIECIGGCTVVFAVAHFERTLGRYPAGGMLVWLDGGVLLGGLHLCASDIGLGSCIIAGAGMLPTDRSDVTDIGGIVVGQSPDLATS